MRLNSNACKYISAWYVFIYINIYMYVNIYKYICMYDIYVYINIYRLNLANRIN